MPRLKIALYQLDKLIQKHLPDIYINLKKKEISCDLFAVQWFLTLFSYDFEPPYLNIVWDIFLIRGWKFIFQLSLAIIKQFSEIIARLDCEQIVFCIKNSIKDNKLMQMLAIRQGFSFKVKNKELEKMNLGEEELVSCGRSNGSLYMSPPMEEAAADLALNFNPHVRQFEIYNQVIAQDNIVVHKRSSQLKDSNIEKKSNNKCVNKRGASIRASRRNDFKENCNVSAINVRHKERCKLLGHNKRKASDISFHKVKENNRDYDI